MNMDDGQKTAADDSPCGSVTPVRLTPFPPAPYQTISTSSPADNPPPPSPPPSRSLSHRSSSFRTPSLAMHSAEEMSARVKSKKRKKRFLSKLSKVDWKRIWKWCVEWALQPVNMAVLIWCIVGSAIFVFVGLLELGFLNSSFPDENVRADMAEYCKQILMALFVLMCVVVHPVFMRHSFLLVRWNKKDIKELRKDFCRGGTRKPNEWFHMNLVVFWSHVTCIATYWLGALYWIYDRHTRSTVMVWTATIVSFIAPALALIHLAVPPLGAAYEEEGQGTDEVKAEKGAPGLAAPCPPGGPGGSLRQLERTATFVNPVSGVPVEKPEWEGTVLCGCCDSPPILFFSCCCTFCVFGHNAERLGFGHRFVQGATFALFVLGPALIFIFAANTVREYSQHQSLVIAGFCMALLGLMYGGWYRSLMRKSYGLPPYSWWFLGSALLSDLFTWVCCCCCALSQEVRTAEKYSISDGMFYTKAKSKKEKGGKEGVGRGEGGGEGGEEGSDSSSLEEEGGPEGEEEEDIEMGMSDSLRYETVVKDSPKGDGPTFQELNAPSSLSEQTPPKTESMHE